MNFQDLYHTYAKDVFRFAYWLSGDAVEAEDITAETFVRAWLNTDRIRTETVKAYLFTIARNLFLKGVQRSQKEALTDAPLAAERSADPAAIFEKKADLDDVLTAMQSLPEIDRAALLMHTYYQIPHAEIARSLGLSLTAVKVKVHRARLKLAIALK